MRIPPDPDCFQCKGKGHFGLINNPFRCECTMVCDCGEERPSNPEYCASPGCTNVGCDSCGEIEWCCSEYDNANGDYFCSECRE